MAIALEAVSVASTQRMEDAGVKKEETGAARKLADSVSEVVVAALSVAICVVKVEEMQTRHILNESSCQSTRSTGIHLQKVHIRFTQDDSSLTAFTNNKQRIHLNIITIGKQTHQLLPLKHQRNIRIHIGSNPLHNIDNTLVHLGFVIPPGSIFEYSFHGGGESISGGEEVERWIGGEGG